MLQNLVRRGTSLVGLEVTRISSHLSDLSPTERSVVTRARPFTMTSVERIAALVQTVEYVVNNKIAGAFVECGVWKGGSSMAAALTFLELGKRDTDLFLFDTFFGLPAPSGEDVSLSTGDSAESLLANSSKSSDMRAYSPIEEVKRNMESTDYPRDRIHLIEGMVEETIPLHAPEQISILRLDTDWYSSTKHELVHLFPRLSPRGVMIIDDYGCWAGARKAVDEYFAEQAMRPLLVRIDREGRICIKS